MGIINKIRHYFIAKDRNIAIRKDANESYATALRDTSRVSPLADGLGAVFHGDSGQSAAHIEGRGEAYGKSLASR